MTFSASYSTFLGKECAVGRHINTAGHDGAGDICASDKGDCEGGCAKCEIGKFADDLGLSECKDCASSEFQDQKGKVLCKRCPAGQYKGTTPIGDSTIDRVECKFCPFGKKIIPDNTNGFVCVTCVTGQYQDEPGSDANGGNTVCKKCATGKFGVPNGCNDCLPGQCKFRLFFLNCCCFPFHSQCINL